MKETSFLKRVAIFDNFTDSEIKAVESIVKETKIIAGDLVFGEGSPASSFYVIKEGTIDIMKLSPSGEDQKVYTCSVNSHFGEMAFLDPSKRTASAVARENCVLLEVQYEDLEKLIHQQSDFGLKLYRTLARSLSRRIRQTTVDLATLRDLKLKHS